MSVAVGVSSGVSSTGTVTLSCSSGLSAEGVSCSEDHSSATAGRAGECPIASAAVRREQIGNPGYPPARRELQKHGIRCDGHAARQVTMEDYRYFDRIYYMDASNARWLARMLPKDPEKIRPLLNRDVADPWYTGDFEQTWEDIVEGCRGILEEF